MNKVAAIPFIVSAIVFIIWATTMPSIRKTSFFLGFVFSALAFLLIAMSPPAQARAGGGFSVGRSSPSISRSYSAPTVVSRRSTTIINNHGGGAAGSGFGGAFVGGAAGSLVGNALSRPAAPAYAAPAVPQPQVVVEGGYSPAPQVVMVEQPGFFDWLGRLLGFVMKAAIIVVIVAVLYFAVLALLDKTRRPKHAYDLTSPGYDFNPAGAFMAVQDAVGKKNLGVLQSLCTPSMYSALLTTNMEPSVIRNLSYVYVEDDVYTFTFLADGEKHKETWCFDDEDRLDGIQVHF